LDKKELQDFIDKHGECEVVWSTHACRRYKGFEAKGYLKKHKDQNYWLIHFTYPYIDVEWPSKSPLPEYANMFHDVIYNAHEIKSIRLAEESKTFVDLVNDLMPTEEPVTLEQFKNEKIAIHCETEKETADVLSLYLACATGFTGAPSMYVYVREDSLGIASRLPEGYRIIKAKDFLRWNKPNLTALPASTCEQIIKEDFEKRKAFCDALIKRNNNKSLTKRTMSLTTKLKQLAKSAKQKRREKYLGEHSMTQEGIEFLLTELLDHDKEFAKKVDDKLAKLEKSEDE
jgi:hypothetical protein